MASIFNFISTEYTFRNYVAIGIQGYITLQNADLIPYTCRNHLPELKVRLAISC
jgi:hypothetical protein